jgi:hypothetical protein
MDATIGKILLEQADDLPAIDQRLEFGGRAQVFKEISALVHVSQGIHSPEKIILAALPLRSGVIPVRFHIAPMY